MGYKRKAKDFPCPHPECKRDFDKESKLKKHYKDKHGMDLPYPVEINMPELFNGRK